MWHIDLQNNTFKIADLSCGHCHIMQEVQAGYSAHANAYFWACRYCKKVNRANIMPESEWRNVRRATRFIEVLVVCAWALVLVLFAAAVVSAVVPQ